MSGVFTDIEGYLKRNKMIPPNAEIIDARWLPAGSYPSHSFPKNRESVHERLRKMTLRAQMIVAKHNEGGE